MTFSLSLTAFLTIIGGTNTPASTLYSSLPIALLLASALFSIRGLIIALGFNVLGIILLPFVVSYVAPSDIMSAAGVISTFGVLLIVVSSVRNSVEALRLAELSKANQELLALRDSLEERVQERSASLSETLRIARLGNWEFDFTKGEFTFNDDFYAVMRTTAEREGGYKMSAAQYAERFVYPEDAPIVGIEMGKSIETTDPNFTTEVSHRVFFGDGQVGYVTVRVRIQKDAEGRTVKSFGANQDITVQKNVELALISKEAQLSEALRIARLGNWEYDFRKDEFTFNDDFYTMMRTTVEREGGYTMNAAQYTQRFVYPEDAAVVGVEIGKSIETTDPNFSTEVDHRVIFGDGEIGFITVRFRIEKDAQGRTIKSIGANQDITEKKKAESELRKFQLALERSTDAVFMTDLDGKIEYANPAFEKTYGYSAEETLGQTPRLLKSGLIPVEQYTHFWNALQQNQVIAGEIINKHKDGRLLPVEAINTSILDTSGNQLGYMATHRDITARKKAEETLAKRAAELETVTQLATAISAIPNPLEMLEYVSNLTKERFGFYHAHVYLLDPEDSMLELAAGAGTAGQTMVARGHAIPLAREQSLVARAARTRQGVLANDVTQTPDFLPNPLLPETRSELAVPLLVRDEVLGVLDVQSTQVNAFTTEDIRVQTILAAQIAVALENTRANEKTAQTLAELDTLTRRLTHEGWQTYLTETERNRLGFSFEGNRLTPLQDLPPALETKQTFVQPVVLRGERIGQLVATEAALEEEELRFVLSAVSQGLSAHLENLRLTEESERRVDELRLVNEIGQALTSEVEILPIIVTVINTINQAFRSNLTYIALFDPDTEMIEIPYMLDHQIPIFEEPSMPLGDGITSMIIKTRRRIFINQDAERRLQDLGAIPTATQNAMAKSFIGIPLLTGEGVVGVLSVQDVEHEGRFTQGDVDLLTTIAANVAVAIQNARLYAQAHKRAQREARVNLIGQKIQSATTVQNALRTAIQELGLALKAKKTVVKLTTQTPEQPNTRTP
ncbi:MAG: GAF domain-containing protein [Anaerolineales bacterium]|nr:GAF domain-containing protein [Anaerolineales bacterium]